MMNNEYEENEELDIKEELLYKIEYLDITTLMYYINNLYYNKIKTEEYKEKNKNVTINKKEYNCILEEIDLIECDEDIQKAIWFKLQDINYDEDFIESRAVAVHSIGAALWLSDAFETIEENSSYPIEEYFANILEDVKTEDLLQLVEWVSYEKLMHFPKVKKIFIDRISEMTEGELTVFFANFVSINKYFNDEEVKSKLEERILNCEKVCIPFYLKYLSGNDNMILKLLNKTERGEQVNAIISAGVFTHHNKKVTTKLKQMLQELSDTEFVRYMCSATKENDELKPIIKERLKNLSDENIRFLTAVYFEGIAPTYKHNILANLAASRDLIEENENGIQYCLYDENIVIPKFKVYCCSNKYFDALPYFTGFDFAELERNQPIVSKQNMIAAFERNSRVMGNYYKYIDFLCSLSKAKDEDLYKIILDVNKEYKFPPDMGTDIKRFFNFTELYLVHRVLNMDNEKLLKRLHILSTTGLPLFDAILIRMDEKGISQPNGLLTVRGNFDNLKKQNDKEKKPDTKDLDNPSERE